MCAVRVCACVYVYAWVREVAKVNLTQTIFLG